MPQLLFAVLRSLAQAPPLRLPLCPSRRKPLAMPISSKRPIDLYRRALKLKPAWEEGLWNLGSITYDLDQYKDCASAFGKLSEVKPDGAPGWTMAGFASTSCATTASALDDLAHVEQLGLQRKRRTGPRWRGCTTR